VDAALGRSRLECDNLMTSFAFHLGCVRCGRDGAGSVPANIMGTEVNRRELAASVTESSSVPALFYLVAAWSARQGGAGSGCRTGSHSSGGGLRC